MKVDELADAINREMENYSEEAVEVMKKSVNKAADDCMNTIKSHISFNERSGKYVRSFKLKTSYEDKSTLRRTWYVANGQYRLTHLLEYGHAKVNGGRTRAFPHIKYGEETARQNLMRYLKEDL